MALAGQKGAYGKLGALSSDLNRAFEDHVELSLRAGAGAHIRTEAVQALADGISASTACRLLAWSICRNHVHVIAELTGEMGVDELVCSWKALAPAVNWESAYHAEALKAPEVGARLDELAAEIGEAETVAAPAPQEGEEGSAGNFRHITVLLHETVDMLAAAPGKLIVDCTLGGGGHTELLLEQGATVWGIDRRSGRAPRRRAQAGPLRLALQGACRQLPGCGIPSRPAGRFPGGRPAGRTWAFPPTSLTPLPAASPSGKTAPWTCAWTRAPPFPPVTW